MRWTLPRTLVLGGALCAAFLFVLFAVFLADEKRATAAAPALRVAALGGVEYEAMDGRPLNPANPVDRQIIAGLPARDRRLGKGEMLFGAFISFTNTSKRPVRSAHRIELRHDAGTVYRPLPLPTSNPYAYSARVVRPGSRIPSQNSVADENLAASGRLLVFRIRARQYSNGGVFELVIHDPRHPADTASLII